MDKLTPNELAFIALTNEFCHALEHANECESRDQFVAQMLKLLPRLYITVNDIDDDTYSEEFIDAALEEETLEGMQEDPDHEGHDHEEGPELDEHIWLSLRNAQTLCGAIADALGALDPDHAEVYARNAAAYCEKLSGLDAQFAQAVAAAPRRTLLFGDRFPFRYLADDYGLDAYAAFNGCSAETEASFETIAFLAGKVDALGLSAVLTLETGDGRIARTIVETTREKSAQILRLDSLQSTTAQGKTYLGAMEENLAVLRQALQ